MLHDRAGTPAQAVATATLPFLIRCRHLARGSPSSAGSVSVYVGTHTRAGIFCPNGAEDISPIGTLGGRAIRFGTTGRLVAGLAPDVAVVCSIWTRSQGTFSTFLRRLAVRPILQRGVERDKSAVKKKLIRERR